MRYDLKSFCYYGTKECLLDISKNIKNRKWKKKKATRMTQPPAAAFQHKCTSTILQLTKKLSNNRRALPQYLQPGSISVSKALRGLAVDENITLNCTILSHFTSTKK